MDLPPVTGRHRNTALAAAVEKPPSPWCSPERPTRQAADELGYANRGTVYRIVHQALTNREAETIDELRALEVARLDAIQLAYWYDALGKDLRAAGLVLRIIEQRCRLLGLFGAARFNGNAPGEEDVVYTFESGSLVRAD